MISTLDLCTVFDLNKAEKDLRFGREPSIQFDKPVGDTLLVVDPSQADFEKWRQVPSGPYLEHLDALCAKWGHKLKVRFYGHYGQVFDGAVLKRLPNIGSLSVDCLQEAINLEAIAELEHLRKLHLGVFELEDKSILSTLPLKQLRELMLSQTNTRALDLAPLAEAANLERLYLEGHSKGIAALAELKGLESFTFNPKKGSDLSFINGMRGLRALKFNLGGTETIEAIALPELQDMAFTRTRGLSELGDMQRFPKLRRFMMQDQPHVESARFGAENTDLEHLWFDNCKKLSTLYGVEECPKLESLRWLFTEKAPASLALPRSVTHLFMLSGKRGEEAAEKAVIEKLGYTAALHREAMFSYK